MRLKFVLLGLKKDNKQRLITMAVEAGMQIRAGVTQNLDFLCGGYNAGPAKLEKSRHQGTTVLTESQFCSLIETGEIPDQ
ncbi:hypothetical protein [Candidatus Vondammii sp. HM_W22]|uniref:hypothetical protein n=1 Tax=Candidatus Vondammii sp. HM_W22 TaxID=2687299 RepID=UPI001F130E28|nr:hypothetical protein [Candidatus Vondammii sp. HM_W22]